MIKRNVCKTLGSMMLCTAIVLVGAGCQKNSENAKIPIEIAGYNQEAVEYFKNSENKFNEMHDDIELKISSLNDAMTVLKTRFIREDNPDIIAIVGEYSFSDFIDAGNTHGRFGF